MCHRSFVPKTSYQEDRFSNFWQRCQIPYTLHQQYKIGRYYADFAHLESRVLIEIDGKAYHSTPEQIARDQRRQTDLEHLGWKVIRLTGSEVNGNPYRVVWKAMWIIKDRLSSIE